MREKTKPFSLHNVILSQWFIILVGVVGVLVRVLALTKYPGGLNQDEAFAGYLSYGLSTKGMDNFGYGNPVYFTAWGSGMNALYSYISIPFIKLLGLTKLAIRLPQAIISCLCMAALYKTAKKMFEQETAVLILLLFAISPWNIVMCRWGLEAAIAPSFVIFGMYFFVLGIKKRPWLLLSALMYGLSLYCYATVWIVIPFVILFQIAYAMYCKEWKIDCFFGGFVLILGIIALPLMLFLLVNSGYINEIATKWISIPRMAYYRGNEISISDIPKNIANFLKIFITQDDGLLWNAVPGFGYYYMFGLPFAAIGFVSLVKSSLKAAKNRELYLPSFFVIHFIIVFVEAMLMKDGELNKINTIHIPVIVFCAVGIMVFGKVLNQYWKLAVLGLYGVSFAMFCFTYVHSYNDQIKKNFFNDAAGAVAYADSLTDDTISVNLYISYPLVLYGAKIPPDVAAQTTVYTNYPEKIMDVRKVGRFDFHGTLKQEYLDKYEVFVWVTDGIPILEENGFEIKEFGDYVVAYKL